MTKKIWSHFQKSFTWYILIGVIVSLCSALAIYFFQQLLDHYQKFPTRVVSSVWNDNYFNSAIVLL